MELSAAEARRTALAAQGLTAARPKGRIDRRHVLGVVDRLGVLQIDSVNVLARSHYLPLFARLGPYRQTLLDDLAYRDRELFETWSHEASFLPVSLQPLHRWRHEHTSARRAEAVAASGELLGRVLAEVTAGGPVRVSDLSVPRTRSGPWWGWSKGKWALEHLFATGVVAVAERRGFERVYDLTERVLPAEVLATPTPPEADARKALLVLAARALGVATEKDLADYFRQMLTTIRPLLAELVEEGTLLPAAVEGWAQRAYLHPGAARPRRVRARALLSPFDSLVWDRARTERIFGFHYRLELYTPAPKRLYGYYVLPFLLDRRLVGRVDLKADRRGSVLRVPGAFAEPGVDVADAAAELRQELEAMAAWLGLDDIDVAESGNLAAALRSTSSR